MERLLEQFSPCFSKPRFRNFTYIPAIVTCDGRKNTDAINSSFVDGFREKFKHQTKPETIYRKLKI